MSKNNLNSQVKRISNNKTLKQPTTSKNRNITNYVNQLTDLISYWVR